MKSIIRIAAVLAAMTMGLISASGATVAKSYDFTGFNKLEFGWVFSVEVVQGSSWSVNLEVTDKAMPYVEVKVSDNTLLLSADNLPKSLSGKQNWNPVAKAKITMPELKGVRMSGSSKISVADGFKTGGEFEVMASGAVVVSKLNIEAAKLALDCSGAAKINFGGVFDSVSFDLSGASKITANLQAQKADIEAAGAANVKISGQVENIDINCAGACDINILKADVKKARVGLSGAAKCQINALEKLAAELSGASSCRYADNAGLKVDIISVSRGASLKKL